MVVSRLRIPSCSFVLIILLLASPLLQGIESLDSPALVILDRNKIYYGNPKKKVTKPAVLSLSKVYKQIPAYKKIISENLKESDARYHLLMAEATTLFRRALKKAARSDGYDLVAEIGAISLGPGKTLPEITELIIKKIKGTP